MQVKVTDGEKYHKIITVELSREEMAKEIDQAYKRIAKKVDIHGFRKGKAPKHIIDNYVGAEAVLAEVGDKVIPDMYPQALDESGLVPVDQPNADIVKLAKDDEMIFTYDVIVKPEITLGEYKALPVTRRIVEVTDEDITNNIESQRQRMAKLVDAEEGAAAAMGDTVTIDFTGFHNDVAFDGGTAENYPLELGSHSFIPGFEEQIVDMKVGEEKDINVTFPEQYQEESLAGEPALFKVAVKEIKHKVMPELNEEFVQEVSETADTLDQYKEEVRARLEEQSAKRADDICRNQALIDASAKCEVDIPPVMIDHRTDDMLADMEQRFSSQGLTMEMFCHYTGKTMEELKESYREQAAQVVKTDLMLEAIVAKEQIDVAESEIDEEIQKMSAAYWQPAEKIRESLEANNQMHILADNIKMKKAVDLIYANAVITDEKVTQEQLAEEQAQKLAADIISENGEEKGEIVDAEVTE